jgi:biotin transport system substrate-specific component
MKPRIANVAAAAVSPRARVLWGAAGVVGFALLTALGAQVAIPLPHTPVPMTLQTLVVLLAGVTLGPRLGLASMAFYLLLGLAGHHVFAENRWGLHTLLGCDGGYLLGFVLAQPVIGWLARGAAPFTGRGREPSTTRLGAQASAQVSWRRLCAAVLLGNVVIFGLGLLWLSRWLHIGVQEALAKGLWPFLVGDLLKMSLAIAAGRVILPHVRSAMPTTSR